MVKCKLTVDPKEAYNIWASQYDSNENKTRDLEARSIRETLSGFSFDHCLEIGCGTGKNTEWLITISKNLTAVDFSEEMMAKARLKVASERVQFLQADITKEWEFPEKNFDLVTFSLMLEHVKDLDHIFNSVSKLLRNGGYIYVGELHPFKQYTGSKARFKTEEGIHIVECFTHHVSDFIRAANRYGLYIIRLEEYFDDDDRSGVPRILSLLFRSGNFTAPNTSPLIK